MWRTRIEKEWDSEEVKMDGKKRKKRLQLTAVPADTKK
jgi:hypothetical protein